MVYSPRYRERRMGGRNKRRREKGREGGRERVVEDKRRGKRRTLGGRRVEVKIFFFLDIFCTFWS